MADTPQDRNRVSTGVPGLDEILNGGVRRERVYLVEGAPGSGKTTLGLQFLLEGRNQGEKVVYATFLQSPDELQDVVDSHGWSLEGLTVARLSEQTREAATQEQTVFKASDVELHEVTDEIVETIQREQPDRLVLDSVSELAALVDTPTQLRRALVRLKQALVGSRCTAFFNSVAVAPGEMPTMETIAHGAIALRVTDGPLGALQRTLDVAKMRGAAFRMGKHDFRIVHGGLKVFPRLVPVVSPPSHAPETVTSGNKGLDELFGGGLEAGSTCLISGNAGSGKSTFAATYADAAARRGERSLIYCFDERVNTFLQRAENLGMLLPRQVEEGRIELRQPSATDFSPGEFVDEIRHEVETRGLRLLVLDSLSGLQRAAPAVVGPALSTQLHDLFAFLGSHGVLTLITMTAQRTPDQPTEDIDATYFIDAVIVLRHFEAHGSLRRCIAVFKKRTGDHERTIREFGVGPNGLEVGPPLTEFSGLLYRSPTSHGDGGELGRTSEETDG